MAPDARTPAPARPSVCQLDISSTTHLVGLNLVELGQRRDAHVSREPRGPSGGVQHGVHRGSSGRLAAGAGHGHHLRRGTPAQEHGELHLDARAGRSRHGQRRCIQRHRGVAHHDLGVAKVLEIVTPEDVAHTVRPELLQVSAPIGTRRAGPSPPATRHGAAGTGRRQARRRAAPTPSRRRADRRACADCRSPAVVAGRS